MLKQTTKTELTMPWFSHLLCLARIGSILSKQHGSKSLNEAKSAGDESKVKG